MKTNLRGLLATMFATGLLAACSSDGGNTQTGTDAGPTTDMGRTDAATGDTGATDVPRVDRPAVDAGNPVAAACGAATDLSTMTAGSDGAIHVMGDNSDGAPVQIGALGLISEGGCLGATSGGDGAKGSVVVYRYTMHSAGVLTASTSNDGTDLDDSVVAILPACTATATPLACNDDVAQGNLLSTAVTRTPLTAGQMVYIVVGGWGATDDAAHTGGFELTVREAPPIAIGMPCAVGAVCVTGSICVGATATNSGTCTADGSAPGAACRAAAPFCDAAFTCSVAAPSATERGICRSSSALGQACGTTAACSGGNFCPNFTPHVAAGADAGTAAIRACVAPVAEAEPNNTPAAAQAAVTGTTVFHGGLSSGTDVDCYAVTVPASTTLYVETSDGNGGCELGDMEDTVVNVYRDGAGAAIATNDDGPSGAVCSFIDGNTTAGSGLLRLAAGTYQVCVSAYGAGADGGSPVPIVSYYLTVGVNP